MTHAYSVTKYIFRMDNFGENGNLLQREQSFWVKIGLMGLSATLVFFLFYVFLFECPDGCIYEDQTKRHLGALKAGKQTLDLITCSQLYPYPTPTLQGWNFLLIAKCKRPLSDGKRTLKMSTRDRRRKIQNKNVCHDGVFWQNLGKFTLLAHCAVYPTQRDRPQLKLNMTTCEINRNIT